MAQPLFKLSIDVTKIDKSLLREITRKNGEKAIFLNLVCWPNEHGRDDHDQDGQVKHDLSKEQRESGAVAKQILGNYQIKGDAPAPSPKVERIVHQDSTENDDIPF
jgi:hypothetical protein